MFTVISNKPRNINSQPVLLYKSNLTIIQQITLQQVVVVTCTLFLFYEVRFSCFQNLIPPKESDATMNNNDAVFFDKAAAQREASL